MHRQSNTWHASQRWGQARLKLAFCLLCSWKSKPLPSRAWAQGYAPSHHAVVLLFHSSSVTRWHLNTPCKINKEHNRDSSSPSQVWRITGARILHTQNTMLHLGSHSKPITSAQNRSHKHSGNPLHSHPCPAWLGVSCIELGTKSLVCALYFPSQVYTTKNSCLKSAKLQSKAQS